MRHAIEVTSLCDLLNCEGKPGCLNSCSSALLGRLSLIFLLTMLCWSLWGSDRVSLLTSQSQWYCCSFCSLKSYSRTKHDLFLKFMVDSCFDFGLALWTSISLKHHNVHSGSQTTLIMIPCTLPSDFVTFCFFFFFQWHGNICFIWKENIGSVRRAEFFFVS